MIKLLILILIHATRQEYMYRNRPVPKAELLDEVLSKLVNRSDYTGSLFNYLTGNDDFGDPDNLDVCTLDANNVFKLIAKAKKKFEPYFRRTYSLTSYRIHPETTNKALDLMRQSIYATRYRMQDTKRYRKQFTDDARFHIAVLYGALIQVTHKMESLYAVMRKLPTWTFLIWYVVIYEKILAAHVDVHNLVDRIFDIHEKYLQIQANKRVRFVPRARKRTETRRRRTRGTGRVFTRPIGIEDENRTTTEKFVMSTIKVNVTSAFTDPTFNTDETTTNTANDTEEWDANMTTTLGAPAVDDVHKEPEKKPEAEENQASSEKKKPENEEHEKDKTEKPKAEETTSRVNGPVVDDANPGKGRRRKKYYF